MSLGLTVTVIVSNERLLMYEITTTSNLNKQFWIYFGTSLHLETMPQLVCDLFEIPEEYFFQIMSYV